MAARGSSKPAEQKPLPETPQPETQTEEQQQPAGYVLAVDTSDKDFPAWILGRVEDGVLIVIDQGQGEPPVISYTGGEPQPPTTEPTPTELPDFADELYRDFAKRRGILRSGVPETLLRQSIIACLANRGIPELERNGG